MQISITENLSLIRALFLAQNANPSPVVRTQISEIGHKIVETFKNTNLSPAEIKNELEKWTDKYLPDTESLVVEAALAQVKKDPRYTLTFGVWVGSVGSGKGTNIETMDISFEILAEAYKAKGIQIPSSIAQLVMANTDKGGTILTGTGGISNVPKGEYEPLFGELNQLIGELTRTGNFIGNKFISFLVQLMIVLRISEGAQKIQIDLWPRTQEQIKLYGELLVKLRVAGVIVYPEMIVLRLLTQQEITAMKENILMYVDKSIEIGGLIAKKLKDPKFQEKVSLLKEMDLKTDAVTMFKISGNAVSSLMFEAKRELDIQKHPEIQIILNEAERAIQRMNERFIKSLKVGEIPRSDGLHHYQMNRLVTFMTDTSPAFMRASNDHVVDFISAYQSPGNVITDVLELLLLKTEKGAFKRQYPTVWHVFTTIASRIAEDIVNGRKVDRKAYTAELKGAI